MMASRKFMLAAVSTAVAAIGLFAGVLTGGEWITATGAILGIYGTANVASKRS